MLKYRQASEQAGAPQSTSSTYESSMRYISSTSKTSTMSSWTSRRPLIGFGMQLCRQPWSTTLAQTLSESSRQLHDKITSAVLFNSSIGKWFQTTVGVQQGCLLSPTLFLERIMTDALEVYEGTVSIGGRTITNFGFADDIDGLEERKKNW